MLTLVGVVGVKSSAEVLREKPVGGESGVRGVEMALGGIGGGGGVRWLRGETSGGVPGVEAGKPLLRPPPLQLSPSTPSPTSCSHPNMADDGHFLPILLGSTGGGASSSPPRLTDLAGRSPTLGGKGGNDSSEPCESHHEEFKES